jgi:hypothetical protein
MRELSRDHFPAPPELLTTPDQVVVEAMDILFEYLPEASGIPPEVTAARIRALVDSPAGAQAYLTDALEPAEMTNAADVVVQLVDALDRPSPHPKELDRDMERRRPRDVGTWH